jgi:hypothetical protein
MDNCATRVPFQFSSNLALLGKPQGFVEKSRSKKPGVLGKMEWGGATMAPLRCWVSSERMLCRGKGCPGSMEHQHEKREVEREGVREGATGPAPPPNHVGSRWHAESPKK